MIFDCQAIFKKVSYDAEQKKQTGKARQINQTQAGCLGYEREPGKTEPCHDRRAFHFIASSLIWSLPCATVSISFFTQLVCQLASSAILPR